MILAALIILIFSFLAIALLFFSKQPQIFNRPSVKVKITSFEHESIWPYFRHKLALLAAKAWHFILEAKDLKPPATKAINYGVEKVKKAFRVRIRSSENEPAWLPEAAELVIKPSIKSPEELYLEAIKKDPADRKAYEALGRLYLQNKNFEDSMEIYEYLTKLDPSIDIYWSNLGLAYFSVKDYRKAAECYEKAIGINGKIPTRWVNLALCFELLEEYNKAVKALSQALVLDKLNLNYKMLLADIYIKLENNVRAEEVLEQILAAEPMNRPAREKLMRLKI